MDEIETWGVIHPHPLPKYVSSEIPRKTVLPIVNSFTSATTAQEITLNVVIPFDPPHLVQITQTPLLLGKNNSNPSTLWNLFQSYSLIPLPIQQILHYVSHGHYPQKDGKLSWKNIRMVPIKKQSLLLLHMKLESDIVGQSKKLSVATYHWQSTTQTPWRQTWKIKLRQIDSLKLVI